tara:strand:+ start:808 stop:975 length:168 start_codon:yes stop_codon:yes gene_type:complete
MGHTSTARQVATLMVEKLSKEQLINEIYQLLVILTPSELKYQDKFIKNKQDERIK